MALRMKSVRSGIPIRQLEENQLAVLVSAPDSQDVGCLVERRGGWVYLLGEESYWDWDDILADDCALRVEILRDNPELTVEFNE